MKPQPPLIKLIFLAGLTFSPLVLIAQETGIKDRFTVEYRNASFENAGDVDDQAAEWSSIAGLEGTGSVKRIDARASDGKYAMTVSPDPAKAADDTSGSALFVQTNIVDPVPGLYGWNSDLSSDFAFRPGMIHGYSVDLAGGDSATTPVYMRLCGSVDGRAIQYWGGPAVISTFSADFVRRPIANRMVPARDIYQAIAGVGFVGGFTTQGKEAPLPAPVAYVDNFSNIQVIFPKLGISDTSTIDFGKVPAKTKKAAPQRTITNAQNDTLPDQRTDDLPLEQIASVLYGIANIKPVEMEGGVEGEAYYFGPTDDVGAVLIGPDAARFAFVTDHPGATPQELRFVGRDDASGLLGGEDPESEVLTVEFLGAEKPGTYSATLRIVTQAGNLGKVSSGGDVPENIHHVDIPVQAAVY